MKTQILRMKVAGMSFRAIGRALGVSRHTAWMALQDREAYRTRKRGYDARYYRKRCGLPPIAQPQEATTPPDPNYHPNRSKQVRNGEWKP